MDLGELVFNLNVRTEALMAGANAAMAKMGELADSEDELAVSSGVLEGKIGVLSSKFEKQRESVRTATTAYMEAVAAHGKTSEAAKNAETALLKEVSALQRLAGQLNGAVNSANNLKNAQKDMSIETIAAYTMMANAAMQMIRTVISAIDEGIAAHNRYVSSVNGLQSVSSGRGISTNSMVKALDQLTDRFFTTAGAATSLKNLLSRGYSLDQAVTAITRLKDAAANGRQMSLSLEQAVVSATEGLKNENSILVDNAGVTKNVSKMWEDFAKAHNVGVQSLSQSQKIMAEYQGIMEETRFQVGDLAKMGETLAGTQASAAQSAELMKRAYGDEMAPAVGASNVVMKLFQDTITSLVVGLPGVASGITTTTLAASGLFVFSKVAIMLQDFIVKLNASAAATTGFAGVINTAMPWLLLFTAALGVGVGVYSAITNAAEKAAKAQEEAARVRQEEIQSGKESIAELDKMLSRYDELSKKKALSYSESREMRSIEQQLEEKYKATIGTLGEMADAYDTVAKAIRNKRAETLADMQSSLKQNLSNAKEVQAARTAEANLARQNVEALDALSNAYDSLTDSQKGNTNALVGNVKNAMLRMLPEADTDIYMRASKLMDSNVRGFLSGFTGQLTKMRGELNTTINAEQQAMVSSALAAMDLVDNSIETSDIPQVFKAKMREIVSSLDYSGGFNADAFVGKYANLLKDADVMPAIDAMKELNEKILSGGVITDAEKSQYVSAYQTLYDALIGADSTGILPSYTSDWKSFFDTMTNGLMSVSEESKSNANAWGEYWDSVSREAVNRLSSLGVDELIDRVKKSTEVLRDFTEDANEMAKVKAAINLLDTSNVDWKKPYAEQGEAIRQAIDILEKYYKVSLQSPEMFDMIAKSAASQRNELDANRESFLNYYNQVSGALQAMLSSGKNKDGEALTNREIAALQSAIDSYALAKAALIQSLEYSTAASGKEFFDSAISGAEDLSKEMRSLVTEIKDAQAKMDVLSTLQQNWGDQQSEPFKAAMIEAEKLYGYRITSQAKIDELMDEERRQWDDVYIMWQAQGAAYNSTISMLQTIRAGYAEGSTEAAQLDLVISNLKADMESMTNAANFGWSFKNESGIVIDSMANMKHGIDDVGKALNGLKSRQTSIAAAKEMVKEAQKLKAAGKDVSETWRNSVSAALGENFTGTLEEAATALQNLGNSTDISFKMMVEKLDEWESSIRAAMTGEIAETLKINPNATVDTSKYEAALAVINWWRRLLGLPEMGGPKSGGGGGGGSSKYQSEIEAMEHEVSMGRMSLQAQLEALEAIKAKFRRSDGSSRLSADDLRDLQERIHDMKERIRQQEIQDDYDLIDHKRHMNQITLQQEIAMLEKIRREHKLTAEERRRLDERIHDAREELRQQELNDALNLVRHQSAMGQITVAQEIAMLQEILAHHQLTAQEIMEIQEQIYALQQQEQQQALDNQVNNVETAYNKIVDALRNRYQEEKEAALQAVDDQIAALQAQTDAENEARRVQDFEEKKSDLERKIRLTKSARERRELQKQLQDLIDDEQLRLAQAARQDQIDTLRNQKQLISDMYAALMDEEALRQEALQLMMSGNLQAMADLIASYGDEWQDAASDLAGYLTTGLNEQKQNVLNALNGLLAGMQDAVNAQIGAAANNSSSATTTARSLTLNMFGTTIREEADVKKVAAAFYREMQRAEN